MDRISFLILKQLTSSLSAQETAELQAWMDSSPARRALAERLLDPTALDEEYAGEKRVNWRRPARDMEMRISALQASRTRRRLILSSAAAIAAVIIGIALWILLPGQRIDLTTGPGHTTSVIMSIDDIIPGHTGAIYRSANGSAITLNASDTSIVANRLMASSHCSASRPSDDLSLEVGRGREFKIILEDSTVVWLNSESTLRYPESFASDSRRVSVTGEAYFEVRPDKSRPFYVESGGQSIRVYGTTFNVRGYPDEDAILTTLETGSVAISASGRENAELYLSPGHQSRFDKTDEEVTMKTVNPEIVTGWRHGKFVFEETPLSTIMRDLSRWYDFEYEFADPSVKEIIFMGSVSRYSDFRTIISILEDSGEVRFSIRDNKVIISHK
ncbi:MAG: DUF4974 domain-containing protein [Paenibacillus sp.]|nr:DUF4974 domain-containing protein [Paenibacillus sp.]